MTLTVLKSQVGDEADYRAAVEAYIAAMQAHAMTEGEPAPVAAGIVESAVVRVQEPGQPDKFMADYEWINDDPPPPPEPTAEEVAAIEKARKLQAIRIWEREAIARVMPPERMRLANLDYARAVRVPPDDRTEAQKAIIAKHEADMDAITDIEYEAAQREAELA